MIPAFWFTQTVELNEEIAKSAKVQINETYSDFDKKLTFFCANFIIDCHSASSDWTLFGLWGVWSWSDSVACRCHLNMDKIME